MLPTSTACRHQWKPWKISRDDTTLAESQSGVRSGVNDLRLFTTGVANLESGQVLEDRLQNVDVDWVYAHIGFSQVVLENDIALLHLTQPVTVNAYAGTICLPGTIEGSCRVYRSFWCVKLVLSNMIIRALIAYCSPCTANWTRWFKRKGTSRSPHTYGRGNELGLRDLLGKREGANRSERNLTTTLFWRYFQ